MRRGNGRLQRHSSHKNEGKRRLHDFLETRLGAVLFSLLIISASVAFYVTNAFGTLDIRPRPSLEAYQWGELKLLANMIASAESDEKGMEIAKQYNLCRTDGTIDPDDTKLMTFGDESGSQKFRIVGFRHDKVAGKDKLAGITFCFVGPVGWTAAGLEEGEGTGYKSGWQASTLRQYASSFVSSSPAYNDKFPVELGRCVSRVEKSSWNRGETIVTEDVVFALSLDELYGANTELRHRVAGCPPVGAEGSQYQFFEQLEGGGSSAEAFDSYPFWLRTKVNTDEGGAALVFAQSSTDADVAVPNTEMSAVLGFCM